VKPLPDAAIKEHLARLPGWERAGNAIRRTWTFADFKGSMAFVNRVAGLAEEMDHHPDIDIRYSRVTLVLSTHDAGGLTARDFALAEKIGA
jgi:4a-hydroxytetrahydrobiopterin dehydratase